MPDEIYKRGLSGEGRGRSVMDYITIKDIIEGNGRTVEENNLAKGHTIPFDTLVEINFEGEYSGMRMVEFIKKHDYCDAWYYT